MEYDIQALGERVKKERTKNGLTIEKLSECIGTSPPFIGLVERGQSGLSLESLCALTKALGVSADYLLFGDGSPPPVDRLAKLRVLTSSYTDRELDMLVEFAEMIGRYRNP